MSETLLHYRRARKCTMTSRRLFRPGGCCFHPLIRVCALPRPRCALPFPNQDGPQQRTSPPPLATPPLSRHLTPQLPAGPGGHPAPIAPSPRPPPDSPRGPRRVPRAPPPRTQPRTARAEAGGGAWASSGEWSCWRPWTGSPGREVVSWFPCNAPDVGERVGVRGVVRDGSGSAGVTRGRFLPFRTLPSSSSSLSFFLSSLPPFLCYVVWWVGVGIDRVTDWDQTSRI